MLAGEERGLSCSKVQKGAYLGIFEILKVEVDHEMERGLSGRFGAPRQLSCASRAPAVGDQTLFGKLLSHIGQLGACLAFKCQRLLCTALNTGGYSC